MVISSPTGSGKTVLFELAICRLLHLSSVEGKKIIYMVNPVHVLSTETE